MDVDHEPRLGGVNVGAPGDTQRVPDDLPMENPYVGEFFVRDCYPVYYDLVIDALYEKDRWCVTITGAPGTGTSLFGAYFFERFRQERQGDDFTITVATTEKYGQIRAAFRSGRPVTKSAGDSPCKFLDESIEDAGNNVLLMIDGPPSYRPPHRRKFVCFTSPDEGWLHEVRKLEINATFYMPTWVPDELWAAATRLGYNMLNPPVTRAMIDDRFKTFGGVARECLAKSESFVRDQLEWLKATISDFANNEKSTITALTGTAAGKHRRLCHIVPVEDDPSRFKFQIASDFVALKLLDTISSAQFEKRRGLISALRGISERAAFRGYLFEIEAHEVLVRGGTIDVSRLTVDGIGQHRTFKCKKSEGFYFFQPTELSKATLKQSGPYHIPGVSDRETVDSFYYPCVEKHLLVTKNRILLFQMTVASRHPPSGKGIVTVLQSIGLLDTAIARPRAVVLVFVVPRSKEIKIERAQQIPWDITANSDSVDKLPIAGDATKRQLEANGIRTVGGDLRVAVRPQTPEREELANTQNLAPYKSILKKFDRRQESIGTMLMKIRQFVWEMP
ncbi:hypothetical protein PR003_g18369 [Phytophthora rubi]|uniref:Uncharacterized protein n=1 Tax=Phytophthora rubi TaxID=129364 RepID=A0A6A4E6V7_9STRA|nr:hypothetical protein PR002_g19339 [Phytophthora rubi]KAE9317882.1 hypothetical protein PR003_g18369 [Phytophthora rubi]